MGASDGIESTTSLMVLDSSYTYATMRRLGLEQSVLARDLEGFFGHVWSVHPFGELSESAEPAGCGTPECYELNERHSFIQARPGRYRALSRLFPLNFLAAQVSLFRRLRKLILREQIALIRAGDPLYIGLFGWMLARRSGIRLVIRVNCNNDKIRASTGKPVFPRLLRSIAVEKGIERFVLKRADLVVAPNQDNIDFAVENGARPDRVAIFRYGNLLAPGHRVAPSNRGIDMAIFKKLQVEPGGYLLCVSRLQELKFPDDSVRSLAAASKHGHDVKLVLAGDGPMRSELEALGRELGVSDQLIFAGNVEQDALQQLYGYAAVVISPLTGRALSEAALGAAPIVAYDLDWQSELVENGVTGELVPFRDVGALSKSVIRLLDDRTYGQKMGRAVRERALKMLDPERLNQHERATYRRLLGLRTENSGNHRSEVAALAALSTDSV